MLTGGSLPWVHVAQSGGWNELNSKPEKQHAQQKIKHTQLLYLANVADYVWRYNRAPSWLVQHSARGARHDLYVNLDLFLHEPLQNRKFKRCCIIVEIKGVHCVSHQQFFIRKVLQVPISRGIQDNWKAMVRRVDVAELQLVLTDTENL